LHFEFKHIFATNFVGSLYARYIKASREVIPIEVRGPEIEQRSEVRI
jgi:hypothetical protein